MSFVEAFDRLRTDRLLEQSRSATTTEVDRVLRGGRTGLESFLHLISPAASGQLEELSLQSRAITQQRFGKVVRLFAPLYLSNECINNCTYCGFSRDNPILRVTLSVDEVVTEARALRDQGFRNILLVAGEHPKFVSNGYLEACVRGVIEEVPSVSLEVGPMETDDYGRMVGAGAEGLVVYQETYDRDVYARMHTAGPKRKFDWRLATPERAFAAGFRRLGVGALFGLSDWRYEAVCVAAHVAYLLRYCWKAQITVSLPRLRPCAGGFEPLTHLEDRDLVQLVCAFRIAFPDVGVVLSTREPAGLRDGLIPLGITMMSAGSHTEPGGYTGAGKDNLHHTVRGRVVELAQDSSEWSDGSNGSGGSSATGQFDIADERAPQDVAESIRRLGYEPVWKDWDAALSA